MDIVTIHQIGITNYPDDRLASHSRLGWKLLEFSGPMLGDVLYVWEKSILKALKESGADIGNTSIADKFDGFSEAWVRSSYLAMPTLSFFTLGFYQITFNGYFNQI